MDVTDRSATSTFKRVSKTLNESCTSAIRRSPKYKLVGQKRENKEMKWNVENMLMMMSGASEFRRFHNLTELSQLTKKKFTGLIRLCQNERKKKSPSWLTTLVRFHWSRPREDSFVVVHYTTRQARARDVRQTEHLERSFVQLKLETFFSGRKREENYALKSEEL